MAGHPTPLFVLVAPAAGRPGDRLERKLQCYFQSQKRSGGGECEVRVEDRERGVYRVQFWSEEAKRKVKASKWHSISSHDQTLSVYILHDSEVMASAEKLFTQNSTSQATSLPFVSNTGQSRNGFEKKQLIKKYTDNPPASVTKKIFCCVSATLNTDLFTKEERDQVMALWPTLKVEKSSRELGVEKVTGDYDDIEKLHRYLEKLIARSHPGGESLHFPGQNGLEKLPSNDWTESSENDDEEAFNTEVPSAIFEYFSRVCKGEVEELEQRFSIKLTSIEDGSGMTLVRFASDGNLSCAEKAQQTFVTVFQKVAADLKQEIISFTDSHQLSKASDMLNTSFNNILVKPQESSLILRGPARELSAAKELVKEMVVENLPKKHDAPLLKTGFLLDIDVFELLEPKLASEIQSINRICGTLIEKKKCLQSQKAWIVFKPETKKKSPDLTSQAYEKFIRAYQEALATPAEKAIPLKPSLDLGKKVNDFLVHLQIENPRVLLKKVKNGLMIIGLPEHVCSAEKHILQFLNTNLPALPAGTVSPIHTPKAGTSSEVSLEPQSGCKEHSFPSGDSSYEKAPRTEPEEELCSICMEKITQKEVLPKCKHGFCKGCIQKAMKYKPVCPVCNVSYGKIEGNQPPGKMDVSKTRMCLPGYEGYGTINITYSIPSGIQKENHPNPGKRFQGVMRTAYLPDNPEGREILRLLQRAFEQKLIFTVGQSRTTGLNDVVTWNDIHHKTCIYGGVHAFGYPDPNYLQRVREELKAKGIE